MANIYIENILCFGDKADVEIAPGITFVSGQNSSGKSCFAKIIAALASQNPNPGNIAKTAKSKYITDGVEEGCAILENDDNTSVNWSPTAGFTLTPADLPPEAAEGAVGIVDFVGVTSAKDAALIWEGLFLPKDPRAILEPKWKRPKEQLDVVIDYINRYGWASAVKMYEGQRVDAKRRWQEVSGNSRYGKSVAANWVPDGWSVDLEGASKESLTQAVADSQDALNAITTAKAISQKEIDEAKKIKDVDIPDLKRKEDAKMKEYNALKKKYESVEKIVVSCAEGEEKEALKLNNLKEQLKTAKWQQEHAQKCPWCSEPLRIDNGIIHKEDDPCGDSVVPGIEDAIKNQETALRHCRDDLHDLRLKQKPIKKQLLELRGEVMSVRGEVKALSEIAKKADEVPTEAAGEAERTKAEQALESARSDLKAYETWVAAKREHENVTEIDEICHLLSPEGARAAIMADAMAKVRKVLSNITEITGWKALSIADDYSLTSGGRPIALTAENEKHKMQWALQIATARISKSKWCVLDACDLLHNDSWDGLINLTKRLSAKVADMHIVILGTEIAESVGNANVIDIDAEHTIRYASE